jgi:ribose transport system ATP-binding protein
MSTAACTSTDAPALQVRSVVKTYGGTRALDGVELTVRPGEVHALLGANGAGKSTLLGVIAGSVTPDAGDVSLAEGSVAIVYQELSLLPELSVAENVCPAEALFGSGGISRMRAARTRSAEALAMLGSGLEDQLDTPVRDLPLDKLELVEIARGLCSGSRIILLDEPTSPLNESQVEHLFDTIRTLAGAGVAVVIVSHRLREVRRVAEVVTVIRDGRTVLDRRALAEVTDQELTDHMIGRSVERTLESYRSRGADRPAAAPRLLRVAHVPTGRSFEVRRHEVVGITALTPDDARRMVRYAWGAARHPDLAREVLGSAPRWWTPRRAARAGVAYVSGDRKRDALFPELDLGDNVMTPTRVVRRRPWLSQQGPAAEAALRRLDVKAADVFARPESLSGGNQQKMLLAAWLALDVSLLLLDDPTRGVDVEAKDEIYKQVRTVLDGGAAALWWSSDTEELAEVSDRVVVVRGAEPAEALVGDQITEASILTAMNQVGSR